MYAILQCNNNCVMVLLTADMEEMNQMCIGTLDTKQRQIGLMKVARGVMKHLSHFSKDDN